MTDITSSIKNQLREVVRGRVKNISMEERSRASRLVCSRLRELPLWQSARSILLYSPLPDEVDVWDLVAQGIREGREILLPRYSMETKTYHACRISDPGSDLSAGKFGIREPNGNCQPYSLKQLDLTLVPALAFDPLGHRLGRGRGFYDRLLSEIAGARCGIAFDEQILPEVPVESHDVPVDYLLTPTQWVTITAHSK